MAYMSKTKKRRLMKRRILGTVIAVAVVATLFIAVWQVGLGSTIAKVGGVAIRDGIAGGLEKFVYFYQLGDFQSDPTEGLDDPEEIAEAKDMVLTQKYSIIETVMIPTEAIKLHLEAEGRNFPDDESSAQIKLYTDGYFSNTAMSKEFSAAKVKRAHVRYYFEYVAAVSMFRDELLESDPVTDEDVQAYYDENSSWWERPFSMRASHILIQDPEHTDEKRAEIEAILEQLDEGADFAELAMEYSEDGSAENGGDLGQFGLGEMVAPFEEACLALDIDEISGIVETDFGFHIIQLTDRTEASVTPIEDYYESIKSTLEGDKVVDAIDELVENTEIEYFVAVAPSTGKLPTNLTDLNESRGIFVEEEPFDEDLYGIDDFDYDYDYDYDHDHDHDSDYDDDFDIEDWDFDWENEDFDDMFELDPAIVEDE